MTPGWQIIQSADGVHFNAYMMSSEGEAVFSVSGFTSERAVAQFLALYLVLLVNAHQDQARELLQSFMQRDTPGKPS
jgi:hypothetical protein